jgi:hypothetical protein
MMARRGPSVVSLNTNPPPSPFPPSESPAAALSSVLCLPTDSHSFATRNNLPAHATCAGRESYLSDKSEVASWRAD